MTVPKESIDLQLKIAEARGWHDVRMEKWDHQEYLYTTEQDVWIGTSPEGEEDKLPDWVSEPGDALLLCYEVSKLTADDLQITYQFDGCSKGPLVGFANADIWAESNDILCDAWEGTQMAFALAQLWLRWYQAQKEAE